MVELPESLGFPEWVRHVFDHPRRGDERAWFWDDDADVWAAPGPVRADYVTRLYADAGRLLRPYSNDQAGVGLEYLSAPHASDYGHLAVSDEVPQAQRVAIATGMAELFRQVFGPRCGHALGHLDESPNRLSFTCHMWWELLLWYGRPVDPDDRLHRPPMRAQGEIDESMLTTLEQVLALRSAACQEAALHGLGHNATYYPNRVGETIDRFLAEKRAARPELVPNAALARRGAVQ